MNSTHANIYPKPMESTRFDGKISGSPVAQALLHEAYVQPPPMVPVPKHFEKRRAS